ncbi:MAG: hypothetical protein AVDCRST_MAG44-1131, partial [uncultured Sphingomonas sp.]
VSEDRHCGLDRCRAECGGMQHRSGCSSRRQFRCELHREHDRRPHLL